MKRFLVAMLAGAALVGGAAASQAQYFDFTSTVTPLTQTGAGGQTALSTPSTTTFTEVGATDNTGINGGFPFGTNIIVANYTDIVSNAADATPDSFAGNTYTLNLTLTPTTQLGVPIEAGQTQTITGTFSGTASSGASNVNNGSFGFTSLTYVFASQTFTVTPLLLIGPQAPGSPNLGSLQYHVVSSLSPTSTPEPGTWAMFATSGIGGLLLLRRRRA